MLSSFYPVVSGRVSDAYVRYRSMYQTQIGKSELQKLQDQLSSGLRFTSPSEDPTAAIRVIGLQREMEFQEQTIKNLDSAQGFLNVTETHLANAQTLLNEIRGLGIEASTNLVSSDERDIWLNQIDTTIQRLQSVANAKHLDRYLFTGGVTSTPTVSQTNRGILFNGNDLNLLSVADGGEYLVHNVTGQKGLGLQSDGLISRTDLAPIATPNTRIADLHEGRGIPPGAIQFSNGDDRVTIDLANAEFVGDILNGINGNVTLGGREVGVSLVNGSLSVQYTDGLPGVLRIQDVASGRTASDLGIATWEAAPALPITGKELEPMTRRTTLLSQLNEGAGFQWEDGLTLKQGDRTFELDFAGAVTVEDVIHVFDRSGADVTASLSPDGRSLRVQSRLSGVDFSISERNGTLAADLGLRSLHGETRLSELGHGQGIELVEGPDLMIRRNDGTDLGIDLDGAVTIRDVLNAINNHPDNQTPSNRVVASLNQFENGLTLSTPPLAVPIVPDPGPMQIRSAGGSDVGWKLGLVPKGESVSTSVLESGEYVVVGSDPNPQEVKGIFNTLARFRDAIEAGDLGGIARAVQLIDEDLARLNLARGSLGMDLQRIDSQRSIKEDNNLALKENESKLMDADMLSVISELNARQAAYEASLRLLANSNQLSLFNYL